MKKQTDQEKITKLCLALNEHSTITTRTITNGDRTIFFRPDGEIARIEFRTPDGIQTVYP
jgi:hypothetical protein